TNSPRRAWFVQPISWRRNGFLVAPDALFLRRGVVWRRLAVFPLARLQSFGVEQGPIDRLLRIANVRAHTIAGPVTGHLEAVERDAAVRLFADVSAAAIDAADRDTTHRWAGSA